MLQCVYTKHVRSVVGIWFTCEVKNFKTLADVRIVSEADLRHEKASLPHSRESDAE